MAAIHRFQAGQCSSEHLGLFEKDAKRLLVRYNVRTAVFIDGFRFVSENFCVLGTRLAARGCAMLFFLIGTTIILGAITGFADSSQGAFFRGPEGQIRQGVLSIACFTLVGAAFWRFGWKMGLLNLFFAIIAANVRLIC
jgi:hypothetical protein